MIIYNTMSKKYSHPIHLILYFLDIIYTIIIVGLNMFNLKIKTTMTTMFILVVITVVTVMIYFQYKTSSEFAQLTTQSAFSNVLDNNIHQIEKYDKTSKEFIEIVKNIENIHEKVEFSKRHILFPIITNYINNNPYVYGIYLGFSDETFYIVYNVNLSNKMRETLDAPKDALWLVKKNKKIDGKIISLKTFLDKNFTTISTTKEETTYKPTQRPWYISANESSEIIKTKPYIFSALGEPGITYAKKINEEKGIVLSLDITLSSLNDLLTSQELVEGSSAFLYSDDGKVLGYNNNLTNTPIKNIKNEFPSLMNDLGKQINTTINGIEYIKFTKQINLSNSSMDYITILSPLEPIMQPYKERIAKALMITMLVVLFVIIPLVYLSVRLLIRPIFLLKEENQKVKNEEYDNIKHVSSFMVEVAELSNSFTDMAVAIKEKTRNNEKLIDIGYKISSEENYDLILENILEGAKELSGADGGTLYILNEENSTLEFKTVINTSLDIYLGGSKSEITWPALQLYDENLKENRKNISVVSALDNKMICIDDVYTSIEFDFTGAKNFDKSSNYKTTSMLVIPMINRDNEVIGVIQLINKIKDNKTIAFNDTDKKLIESMASISAMAIHNRTLVQDLKKLLYGLVESIGGALGEKSSYTGKHSDKVAELTLLIANAINEDKTIFKETNFNEDEMEEIKLAAWLHDIGKITTPEYVVDKATRLETIYDRLHFVEAKIEIAKNQYRIKYLEKQINKDTLDEKIKLLEEDLDFIKTLNKGGEFMSAENKQRLDEILTRDSISINNQTHTILDENEHYNLSIQKGTLTDEERDIINNHVKVTYSMLAKVHFPKKFSKVPVLAGSHHKTIDGKGYGHDTIMDLEMSVADKILAVADIFEALSAHDRPYRAPNKLSQVAKILMFMVQDKHIDQDIVKLFLENKVYESYVEHNFLDDQIDEINIDFNEIRYKDK